MKKTMAIVICAILLLTIAGCTPAAQAAQPDENGNYLINGGFEDVDLSAWTLDNVDGVTDEIDVYDRSSDVLAGAQALHFYSAGEVNFTIEQTVSGLESGSYKVSANAQGDSAGDENYQCYVYVKIGEETLKGELQLNGYLEWNSAEITGIEVDGEDVVVGICVVNAPGGWGTIDELTLTKE